MKRSLRLSTVCILALATCSLAAGAFAEDKFGFREARNECLSSNYAPITRSSNDTTTALDPVAQSLRRSRACRSFYLRAAGAASWADAGESALSGSGALGLLASGGRAAATTNTYLAAFTLAPVVFRDVTRQEPQAALAFQAAEAVRLTQCHAATLKLRFDAIQADVLPSTSTDSLDAVTTDAVKKLGSLQALVVARRAQLLSDAQRKAQTAAASTTARTPAAPTIAPSTTVATPAAAPVAEPTFADLARQDAYLRELAAVAQRLDNAIMAADDLAARFRSERNGGFDNRLAQYVGGRLDMVNQLWSSQARNLVPTPESSLRNVLAAPLSLSAQLIAGKKQEPQNADAVARATYDFSSSRVPLGIRSIARITPPTGALELGVINEADWVTVGAAIRQARNLSSLTAELQGRINGLAELDQKAKTLDCPYSDAPMSGVAVASTN